MKRKLINQRLDVLSDELFLLVSDEEISSKKLVEASEGLLPRLSDALRQAGFYKRINRK